MVKKEDLVLSDHSWVESHHDGISRNEIADALSRGARVPQSGHFITIYKYFTVVYRILPDGRYKIITVHSGHPRRWKKE